MARFSKKKKPVTNRENGVRHAALSYKPPIYFRLLHNGLYIFVGTAMAAVLYTIYWFYIATNLKDGVNNWIDDRARQGIHASYKNIEIGGFPSKFRVLLREPKMRTAQLAVKKDGQSWHWRGSIAVAEMTPWNFSRYQIDLSGDHQFDLISNGKTQSYSGSVGRLVLKSVIDEDGWPQEATLDVQNLDMIEARTKAKISGKSAAVKARRLFSVKQPAPQTLEEKAKSPSFAAEIRLKGVQLPKYLNLPLGHRITHLFTDFKIIGSAPDLKTLAGLSQWRDEGGTVEIDVFESKYGPLYLRANGTLALDNALQPMGAVTAKFKGFFQTIDKLKDARLIRSRDAAMSKVVLGVLAKRPAGGGQSTISLPLSLQESKLNAGPIRLMKIPPIDWTALGFAKPERSEFKILK